MRHLVFGLLLVAVHFPAFSVSRDLADATVNEILVSIKLADCGKAVKVLKEGLARQHHEVSLLAGGMYQEGLCVKKDWDKAVEFYLLAREQGSNRAVSKLIAGYAAPLAGPDAASALWWAQSEGVSPSACKVPTVDHDDVDKFVKALSTWPKARVEACTYTVGVTAALNGDMEYPALAAALHMKGKVKIIFNPAVPEFQVDTTETETVRAYGMVDGDMLRDQKSSYATGSFKRSIQETGAKILARYKKPAHVDPEMKTQVEFVFTIVDR